LIGLGVRELSVAPGLVPTVKHAVRETNTAEARQHATDALAQRTAADARATFVPSASPSTEP
jgi:phosphoenolpyruvate-protein kinase (PTS system EI component)